VLKASTPMQDEPRVWVSSRKCRRRKRSYHLRWLDPATGIMRSRKSGTDRKKAENDRAALLAELRGGRVTDLRPVTWQAFTDEHVSMMTGGLHAADVRRTLEDFGEQFGVSPRRVTYGMVEAHVDALRARGFGQATVNKRLRLLRGAFNKGVQRGYLAVNPMANGRFEAVDLRAPRIVTPDEETALLDAAEKEAGLRMRAFVYVALNTGARRGELLGLTWDRVDFEGERVHFTHTKGKRDRYVPIGKPVVDLLRRLQMQTLKHGGPFVGMMDAIAHKWSAIVERAKVAAVTPHDLRRTYVTRLIRAGVPLPTVQKLVGHADIQTTMVYYTWVSDGDLKDGVAKLQASQSVG